MDIGIFGLWGMNIPTRTFGGFETVYSEVAIRLADLGHQVTVYSRRECYTTSQRIPNYKGVNIIYVPTINSKSLSFLTAITSAVGYAVVRKHHDVFLFVNVGSGFHCLAAKLFGKKTLLNVDGLDWARPKWNSMGQLYFKLAARAALFSCDVLLTDGNAMVEYYRREFHRTLDMISYGAYIEKSANAALLDELQLRPFEYYLVVTRLIPDNNIHLIVEEYQKVSSNRQLVVVGDANYDGDYQRQLRNVKDPRIRFVGRIHDQQLLKELYCNCYGYIHGHSVGGTNPALLKALGYGTAVLALNTPFNAEVLVNGTFGELWKKDAGDLLMKLQNFENNPDKVARLRAMAPQRIKEAYSWEQVTAQYVDLLDKVKNGRSDSLLRMKLFRLGLGVFLLLLVILIWRGV
ncbi:MAG: DUF1972 domain-containing protein [Bacteroidota bacterium]